MSKPEIYKYNPSLADPRELEATFVGRECLLDDLLDKLRKRSSAKSNQHLMIVGPRGIGKTNTLLILQNRIRNDETLSKTYLPLTFSEEEYSIISLRDFFVKILELLHESDPSANGIDPASVREAPDEEAVERSIFLLKEYSVGKNLKLLLFIDNFDLIFSEQIKQETQARRLRDILMNDNFLFLVGAAPSYFGQIMEYERSFYNFFQIYHLDEFDTNLMEAMLIRRAEYDENRKLIDQIKEYRPRLEGLRHLTGGNPRLVLMLYQILSASGLPEVKTALNSLLDDLTPYYKHKLESIRSPQQRKIVDTLARMDRAATPTELAKETRLPVNQVSSLIKRLQDEGYLRPTSQQRHRTTYYILSERLFRIWHQMRYATIKVRRMPFLVEFIGLWYSMDEMKKEYAQLEGGFKTAFRSGKTEEALSVLDHIGYLAESAPSEELKSKMFDSTIRHYMELEQWDAAQAELENELNQNLKNDNKEQAAKYHWGLGIVWHNRSEKSNNIIHYQKAFEHYQSAVTLKPDMYVSWCNWGMGLDELAQLKMDENLFHDAFSKFERAVAVKPDEYRPWNAWGIALRNLAHLKKDEILFREAFSKYKQAITVKPDMYIAWYNWGIALDDLAGLKGDKSLFREAVGKYERAFQYMENSLKSVESPFKKSEEVRFWWYTLSRLMFNEVKQKNHGKFKDYFRRALVLKTCFTDDDWNQRLVKLVHSFFSKENMNFFNEIIEILKNKKFEEAITLLQPYTIASEYWLNNGDNEVLERLNPELREMVEAIIKKSENSSDPDRGN